MSEAEKWEWAISAHTLAVATAVIKHHETCPLCGQNVSGLRAAEKAAEHAERELQRSPVTRSLWA